MAALPLARDSVECVFSFWVPALGRVKYSPPARSLWSRLSQRLIAYIADSEPRPQEAGCRMIKRFHPDSPRLRLGLERRALSFVSGCGRRAVDSSPKAAVTSRRSPRRSFRIE